MTITHQFLNIVQEKLNEITRLQNNELTSAAGEIAQRIINGGIIYIFGCGHSHIFAEDVFYRAGGIAPVRPIFIEPLMLHQGAAASSRYEKQNDYINSYLDQYNLRDQDTLIVISTSGINPAPIDAARWGKRHGAFTLAVTSFIYAETQRSRHKEGLSLKECVDMAIDNRVPVGDAVLSLPGHPAPFAPVSSMTGIFIIQALFAEIIANLSQRNYPLPIFLSGNIDNSEQHNQCLLKKYGDRIPELINNVN